MEMQMKRPATKADLDNALKRQLADIAWMMASITFFAVLIFGMFWHG
jgi:hypothetical protein